MSLSRKTRFTAWAEYQLVDGPRRKLRVEQRKNPKIWAKEPDGRTRRTAGAQVKLWGDHHAGNVLLYCEGEMAAAAMVSAGLNERGLHGPLPGQVAPTKVFANPSPE